MATNKEAQTIMAVRDIILVGILFLAIGMTLFLGHYIGKTMNTQLKAVPAFNNTETQNALDKATLSLEKFDYIFFAVFIGSFLAIIITSWFVSAHPIFMWLYFFVLIFIVAICTIFSKVWTEFVNNAAITSSLSSFGLTNHILTNLPTYIAVMGLLGILILFGKPYLRSDFG